jgi:hypothetical protein
MKKVSIGKNKEEIPKRNLLNGKSQLRARTLVISPQKKSTFDHKVAYGKTPVIVHSIYLYTAKLADEIRQYSSGL